MHHSHAGGDFDLLRVLASQPSPSHKQHTPSRRPQLDPLILETASVAGPQVTRNHYLHEFYPHMNPYYTSDLDPHDSAVQAPHQSSLPLRAESQQAPRSVRLRREKQENSGDPTQSMGGSLLEQECKTEHHSSNTSRSDERRRLSAGSASLPHVLRATQPAGAAALAYGDASVTRVVCHARTRVPTPHGEIFIHIYKNNQDSKEHLAFVFDKKQLQPRPRTQSREDPRPIRSKSLDAVWHIGETEQERIVRGAYVGRLEPDHAISSSNCGHSKTSESPLVRIHSECFTGETIGSQRCDCGEQLDEAFRIIATDPTGRGIIIYLRQEGRGIGLLEKLRAYNLQDLGYDTVTANLMLGHNADMRSYDVAGAILRDLGVEDGVRLLTNNPEKIEHIEREGISIVERLPMVPRSWRKAISRPSLLKRATTNNSKDLSLSMTSEEFEDDDAKSDAEHEERSAGVGMIGAGTTRSPELDRYLKTKIEKMGHMLDLHESMRPSVDRSSKHKPAHSVPVTRLPTPSQSPGNGPRASVKPFEVRSPLARSQSNGDEDENIAQTDPESLGDDLTSEDSTEESYFAIYGG